MTQRMRIPIESATTYRGRNSRPNLPALVLFVGIALGVGIFAAAFSPLYASMSDAQKAEADALFRNGGTQHKSAPKK